MSQISFYTILVFLTVLKYSQSLSFRKTPISMSISAKSVELGSRTTAKQVSYDLIYNKIKVNILYTYLR